MHKADVIVVGLGAMGSAAAFQLATRGVSVLGIDRFVPPHPWGSTHADTRVTRRAIAEGDEYVSLVRRSHELWRLIEEQTGTQLLAQSGIVVLGHPSRPFVRDTRACAERRGIAHEDLTTRELRTRFPMFTIDDETEGYFEPDGGYVRPEAAVSAQLQLARRSGAVLRFGEPVTTWSVSANGVRVTTDRRSYGADRLILCVGAWVNYLFPEGREIFRIYRQLLYWFPIRHGYDRLREMPVFAWDLGGHEQGPLHLDGFYGFPPIDGPRGGVKVGAESFEHTTTPDGRQHPASPTETRHVYNHYIAPRLPSLGPQAIKTASCLYTTALGNRFLIDRHPEHNAVVLVSACSGHGFKHSPAIGEAVAQWLTGDEPSVDLLPFAYSRAQRLLDRPYPAPVESAGP